MILLIKAEILNRDGVLFCERNAAACGGTLLKAGARGLEGCFADMVHGERTRGLTHHPRAATDLQAEALVPGPIPLAFVMNIVTPTNEAAGNAWARLQAADLNPDQFTWLVSKDMFDKRALTNAVQSGQSIPEREWNPHIKEKRWH